MGGGGDKGTKSSIKKNIEKFPGDFRFRLTKEEGLRSQIVTFKEAQGQHLKYLPYAFTENGIAMLNSVLKSETTIEVYKRTLCAISKY